ncbi:PMP-22/EMP/MP20/Claudin superfamily, partial [Trinorchestia longiramus]
MVVPPRDRITASGWAAVALQVIGFLLISVAMFTRSWIAAESKAYGTSVDKIGLWWQCFRSYSVPKDIYHQRLFVGCRWIFDAFTTGYDDVREMLATPFFVAVQVFFTLCFML